MSKILSYVCWIVVFALSLAVTAGAATLVFPESSPPTHTHCEYEDVENECAIVKFTGGRFATGEGASMYVGGYNFQSCESPTVGWQFPPNGATSLTVTILNGAFVDGQMLRLSVSDTIDGAIVNWTSLQGFPKQESTTVTAAGDAMSNVSLTVVNEFGTPVQGWEASWAVQSMDVVQPVKPFVDLRVARNGADFTALISYSFPSQSAPNDRSIRLELLPSGKEEGVNYSIEGPFAGSGTVSQSLGAFESDRMLRVMALACSGTADAEATVHCTQCKGPPTKAGDPVRLFDGVMTYSETDPLPATLGGEFGREYSSGSPADGMFGLGWSSIFDAAAHSVDIDADNKSVAITSEDRSQAVFRLMTTGRWRQSAPAGGAASTLTGSEAAGYTLRDAGGSIVRTFTGHRLVRVQDLRRNLAVSITYDGAGNPTGILDESGKWSCTVTMSNGHVTGISVDGRPDLAWTYTYSGSLLTAVTVAGASSPWRTYEYTNNRLSVIRDASGSIIESHDYDALGRATSSYGASGDITLIQYPPSDANGIATTTVTRADSSQATFELAFSGGSVVTQKADGGCSSCGATDATAAYDANGNLVRIQNGRGYITRSTYAVDGRRLASTTTAMTPNGCNPETDSAHCRLTADALALAVLASTTASQTTTYAYEDPVWPDRPTRVARNSVIQPGGTAAETVTFHPTTGETLVHTVIGAVDAAGTQESHVTTTVLYGTGEGAAFNPGGAFQAGWLPLSQPIGKAKSVDGPRTDVADTTTFAYYPGDPVVPGPWREQLAAIRNAAGHITRYEDYDVFGHAATMVDANGVVTHMTFDPLGRLATSTTAGVAGCDTAADPLCATDLATTRLYAGTGGVLVSEQRPAGNLTTYAYDSRGRVQSVSRGTAAGARERIEYTYDPTSGKKSSEVISAFENQVWVAKKSETYTYTSTGELASVVHADSTSVVYGYLPDGTLGSVQDENHAIPNSGHIYDPAGRLASLTQTLAGAPGGQIVTSYAYDIEGNLKSVTDPNGNLTTYIYDDFGRMQRQTSPVSGVTTYTYDAAGNALTTTDANGATNTRAYDALNRVTSSAATRAGTTETVSWTYDDAAPGRFGIGRLATLTDPTGSTDYRYDRRGLLRSEVKTIAGSTYATTYAHDANGNRATMTYPNALAAQYTFDFADRPYSLTAGPTTIVSAATYLPFGPITSLAFGNGTTRTVQYDNRYRPLRNTIAGPGGTIADYTYAEDNAGNITQIHDATEVGYNRDFGYDDLNRLITANSGALLWGAGSYTYDRMGNMLTSALGTWKTTTSSLVGTTPKLTSVLENGSSRAVSYDSAGNETFVGASAYAYSPRNQVASADAASYAYDGRGVMTVATVSVLAVSAVPSSVTGGGVATGTVTLSAPAAADTTITLSSNAAAATVPASAMVITGATTASFTITTMPVIATTAVTITAAFNQYSATTEVFVLPAGLSSLGISPSSVLGGSPATGTVTLNGIAAQDRVVALSSNHAAVTVPPSVTVTAGNATATFSISTTAGVANVTATVTATLDGTSRTATLALAEAEIASLSISPSSLLNGGTATGTVTLNGTAGSNIVVTLSSSAPDAYPTSGSVTILQGTVSRTFTIGTSLRSVTPKTVTITATHGAVTRQATVTVTAPWLTTLTLSPFAVVGGQPSTATGTLNGPAPMNAGYQVTFTSSNTNLVATPQPIPYSISTTGQTGVLTNPVTTSTPVVISGTDSTGISVAQTITLQPAPVTLISLTLSQTSIVGSNALTGTVTLTSVAPSPGIDVDLRSTNRILAYPGMLVRVPTGSLSATFTVRTSLTTANATVTLSAIHAATTKTAALTVTAPTVANYVGGLQDSTTSNLKQVSLTGGTSVSLTAFLGANATKNTAVTLSSSHPAIATVPATVTVLKNALAQAFTVTTSSVTSPVDVTVTATAGGTVDTAHVIVLPAGGVALSSIEFLYPFQWQGLYEYSIGFLGHWKLSYSSWQISPVFGFGRVLLTGPAPAGGLAVSLSGSRANVMVVTDPSGNPATTITVPVGQTSANIIGQIYPFTGIERGTTLTASLGPVTRTTDGLVTAQQQAGVPPAKAILCASLSLAPCLATAAFIPTPLAVGDSSGYSLYTPELHLLAETEISTASTKSVAYSYLWFGDLPVASVEVATNTIRWFATDHMGTPLLQTNTTGVVVWRSEQSPYGDTFSFRAGAAVHQPLRLPGQIAQDGSDLSYNVFRHYRSSWGRYTQADPIGLDGGLDVYSYAADGPMVASDPLGLLRWRYYTQQTIGTSTMRDGCTEARFRLKHACIGACELRSRKEFWRLEYEAEAEFFIFISRGGKKTLKHEMEHVTLAVSGALSSLATLLSYEKPRYRSRSECDAAAAKGVRAMSVNAEHGQAAVDDYYGYLVGKLWAGRCQ